MPMSDPECTRASTMIPWDGLFWFGATRPECGTQLPVDYSIRGGLRFKEYSRNAVKEASAPPQRTEYSQRQTACDLPFDSLRMLSSAH